MDELVFIKDKQVVMDSLTVAETFNKEHARVLRDVRELECSEGWSCTQKYTNSGTQSTDYKEVMLAKGDRVKEWTPAPEDMATQSQISQLSDAINLRVHKGEVMSQINEMCDLVKSKIIADLGAK